MAPLIYYKCSKCKMTRDTYEDAEKYESSHFSAGPVREVEYRLGPYPFRIMITFPDGKEIEYIKQD